MKNRQAWGVAAAVILALALAVGLYKMGSRQESGTDYSPVLREDVKIALEGRTKIASTEKGKLSWTMTCSGLEFYRPEKKASDMVKVSAPIADIPLEDGGTARVEAKEGIYYRESEDIILDRGISAAISRDGQRQWTIDGETASYRGEANAFYVSSMKGTMFPESGGTVFLSGNRAKYDSEKKIMSIKGDVNIILKSDGQKEWELSGDTASYEREQDIYHLAGMSGIYTPEEGNTVTISGRKARYLAGQKIMRLFENVHVELFQKGEKEWVLEGETASYYEESDTYHVSGMKAERFDEAGKALAISGAKGTYKAGPEKMELQGSVAVNWSDDVALTTDSLDYDARSKTATTEDPVRIAGEGWNASGQGLWANTEDEKVIIKRDVKMKFERGFSGGGMKQ